MAKKNSLKNALITSALSLVLCSSALVGTTYAWFTDSVTSNSNIIQTGTLKVDLELLENGSWTSIKESKKAIFNNNNLEPGYMEVKMLKIENEGSLALKYKLAIVPNGEVSALADVIDVYILGSQQEVSQQDVTRELAGFTHVGTLRDLISNPDGVDSGSLVAEGKKFVTIALKMREKAGNEYQDMSIGTFSVQLLATQYTYEEDSIDDQYDKDAEYPIISEPVDEWDGTADTSWYNDTDTVFTLTTAEQFAGLAKLVDGGNDFAGKTVKLAMDLDLYLVGENGERVTFDPIGDKVPFEGTFDGQGHTVENLWQSGWDLSYDWYNYGSIGLFGEVKDATIKNVTISGAESLVEGGDVGGITGSASGTCVFENITIEDSAFATYNNGNGGIIGWSGAGNYTFKNITIAEDVTLAGLWGSFDSSIGGVVGQGEPGATYNFENVDIACRLDVYNDCTASYDYYLYRMCGMIIGRLAKTTTIDGTNYPDMSQYNITCNNVTVTYGDWANYHYCEPTPGYNNGRGMRVEPGYSYDGLPADYDHSQCTTNHNTLIPFDQIFGGAQYGVKGLPAYDGVTVIYNNK